MSFEATVGRQTNLRGRTPDDPPIPIADIEDSIRKPLSTCILRTDWEHANLLFCLKTLESESHSPKCNTFHMFKYNNLPHVDP